MTTNPFFTPTQYGAEDACKLLGVEFKWTSSVNSVVAEMVDATNTAITSKADGLALAVVDKEAFRAPVDRTSAAGIPVVSFNADGSREDKGTNRLAYIGQGLYESGYALGQRALAQIDSSEVAGFIATPRPADISPASMAPSRRSSTPVSPSPSPRSRRMPTLPRVCPSSTPTCRVARTSPACWPSTPDRPRA